jgi:hypothetical protein
MSRYEMLDYDELLERIGIAPGQTWFCGDNPPTELAYQEAGLTYDALAAYTGNNQMAGGGLCLTEDINVNGLLLNHRDRNGTIWLCTEVEGWWTLPPSEIPDVPKPFWDGSLLTTGRYLPRTITISGCFIPPDPSLVWYNRDAILRVSSIVRGIGLLAMCGNQSPEIKPDSTFFDAPKMTIIQMNDVPLIETIRPNGFTQFSLSFRCVNPTKVALREKSEPIPVEKGGKTRQRRYRAFSQTFAEDTGPTTSYSDLLAIEGTAEKRFYSGVENVTLDSLIAGEELTEPTVDQDPYYEQTAQAETVVLHNGGNYFAFPIFVFHQVLNATKEKPVTVRNITTQEVMKIQQPVDPGGVGEKLVIDTNLRRVGVVDPDLDSVSWKWDDRKALSLTSQWISLAPGDNTIIMSTPDPSVPPNKLVDVSVPVLPTVYWRDTWIG